MKKLITVTSAIALAGALALSLTACGGTPTGASSLEPSAPSASAGQSESTAQIAPTGYFGKISSVAGNEIELNLAKEPEMPESESAPKEEGDIVAAVEMTPAVAAGTADDGAANRVEVEFTGEMKSFVLPAGMPIKDAAGNEKQLSDIQKGSIMNIFADENGNVTEVFLYE